ncbi:MAG: hypothetical protein IKO72_15770 [Kiritimatiellae bacterium]|nr:hypothetical protein [Kiritimatiellia bacterium]
MKKLFMAVAALAALGAEAKVTMGTPFADGMVLQRGRNVPVWGWANPGAAVTVTFAGQKLKTSADKDGRWRVDLAPMDACKAGRTLVVSAWNSSNARWTNMWGVFATQPKDDIVELSDVLVGEVWYCCGQSNTELPLVGGSPRFRDRQGAMVAQMTRRPYVRFAYCSNYKMAAAPRQRAAYKVEWKKFTPESLAGGKSFSAMGVYYALELYAALEIPIGIVGSYWGGTRAEPWTPREGFAATKGCEPEAAYQPVVNGFKPEMAKSLSYASSATRQPMVLWNEMVAPWTPFAMRGFIWYQGCSNADQHERYATIMHALYNGWSKCFENPDLKLYFVQLAPWGRDTIPYIQQAQARFAAEEKNAAMAVINDIGNLADIHPNEKELVAKRLALHALKRDYGYTNIEDESPTLKEWKIEGDKFVMTFNHAKGFYVYNPDRSLANGFEIAGEDGKFVPAKIVNAVATKRDGRTTYNGSLEGAKIVVAAEGVAAPKKLRYLYSRPWFGSIYNEVNLPLGSFHIGD